MAGLIGGTALGLVGALMAIPVAAGLKVVLAEQLKARDMAAHEAAPEDGKAPARLEPAGKVAPSPAAGSPARADGHADNPGRADGHTDGSGRADEHVGSPDRTN